VPSLKQDLIWIALGALVLTAVVAVGMAAYNLAVMP